MDSLSLRKDYFPFQRIRIEDCCLDQERRWRACLRKEVCCTCGETTEEYEVKTSTRHQAASEEGRRGRGEEREKRRGDGGGDERGEWGMVVLSTGFCTFRTCQVNNRVFERRHQAAHPPSKEHLFPIHSAITFPAQRPIDERRRQPSNISLQTPFLRLRQSRESYEAHRISYEIEEKSISCRVLFFRF